MPSSPLPDSAFDAGEGSADIHNEYNASIRQTTLASTRFMIRTSPLRGHPSTSVSLLQPGDMAARASHPWSLVHRLEADATLIKGYLYFTPAYQLRLCGTLQARSGPDGA